LVPFLRSIFDPFLDFSWTRICLFQRVSCPSKVVFGPFSDVFWTVHFITILPRLGPPGARWLTGHCPLVAYQVVAALASGPFVDQYQGREVLHAACFGGFLRCWFFHSRFSSRRPFATHSSVIFSVWDYINPDLLYERMVDIAPWFRSLVLVRSGWLHRRDRTSDSVDGS
jgi:hypothetical protein